jgi:hypothetical protein
MRLVEVYPAVLVRWIVNGTVHDVRTVVYAVGIRKGDEEDYDELDDEQWHHHSRQLRMRQ